MYATKALHDTIKDAIFIYSAGKFVSQWNNLTEYGTAGHNRISSSVTGNFTSTKVEYASFRLRKTTGATTATGAAQKFVNFTATTSGRTTVKAGVNTATVTEANEWYSHIATSATPAKTSVSRIPGVRYVYNVCDTKVPGYDTCKSLVGFDNQNHNQTGTQTTGLGTKSRLCAGDLAATISAERLRRPDPGRPPAGLDNVQPGQRHLPGVPGEELPRSRHVQGLDVQHMGEPDNLVVGAHLAYRPRRGPGASQLRAHDGGLSQ